MKKIILLLTGIAFSLICVGQQIVLKDKYFAQPDLQHFVGEWTYSNDSVSVIINLRLEKFYFRQAGIYMDRIQGDYTVKKNGNIIASSVGLSDESSALYGGAFVNKDASKKIIKFLFTDLNRKSKRGDVTFELLNKDMNEAKWKLTNTEGFRFGNYDHSFSVPRNFILKKVK